MLSSVIHEDIETLIYLTSATEAMIKEKAEEKHFQVYYE
jgi:hypothetical protein